MTWTIPNTPSNRVLANMVLNANPGSRLDYDSDWLTLTATSSIHIRTDFLELAYGARELQSPLVEEIWSTLFDRRQGILIETEDGYEIVYDRKAAQNQRGWHILIDAHMHKRWEGAAEKMGMTKKAFTTMCIEYFIRTVLDQDREQADNIAAWLSDA